METLVIVLSIVVVALIVGFILFVIGLETSKKNLYKYSEDFLSALKFNIDCEKLNDSIEKVNKIKKLQKYEIK